ncbi:MAG: ATP synthase F1 subunit epsilon [Ignavibacteriaceae bacterium]|nr:ATP synthase F1 subunit epsilon [Ignavibacteriaceae bacterium]
MKNLDLEIITPSKPVYHGEVVSVTIPGTEGSFQVLRAHAPLMSTFEVGGIKIIEANNNEVLFATSGGTVEVLHNKILILADSLERADEINVQRAENSAKRAQDRLSKKGSGDVDVPRAEAALTRALNRLRIAKGL